jgi:GT2 family glycosyltransferase
LRRDGIYKPARSRGLREVGSISARVARDRCGLFDNFVSGAVHLRLRTLSARSEDRSLLVEQRFGNGASKAARGQAARCTLPVSVIMPTFNRADTLPRALSSVLAQRTYAPAEIVVVDDHSGDASGEIARSYGARVIRHERNQGAAAARNTAVAAATQPWLAMLDSDDEWLEDHLEVLWRLRGGHVLVAGASMACFDEAGQPPMYSGTVMPRARTLRSPASLIPLNPLSASAVLVAREAVVAAGGYNTELGYAEDWDLWLRVLERGTGVITPSVVCLYHVHAGSKSQHSVGPAEAHDRIVRSYVGRPWCSKALLERWSGLRLWGALETALSQGRYRQAARLAGRLVAHPQRLRAVVARRLQFSLWMRRSRHLATRDARVAEALRTFAAAPSGEPG